MVAVRYKYQEKPPVYWQLQEVRHRQICGLIDLPQATAVVRVENGPGRHTKIDRVRLHPYDANSSPFHHELFRQDVIEAHPHCYLPWAEARRQIEQRQTAVFGTTFSLGFAEPPPGWSPFAELD